MSEGNIAAESTHSVSRPAALGSIALPRQIFIGWIVGFFERFGELAEFCWHMALTAVKPPYEFRELLRQMDEIGAKSFPLVALAGAATGVVMSLQTRDSLVRFGAKSMLPTVIIFSLIRETGPVITGLIASGRVGAGIGAELGSMKVTEQIDAMEVSAVIRSGTWRRHGWWPARSCCRCSLWRPICAVY